MSDDEIRYWIRELHHTYGWGSLCLGRTLGLADNGNPVIHRKANGKEWLYPGERKSCARQIERILSGELIERRGVWRTPGEKNRRSQAVIAARPVPLFPQTQWAYDLKRGRLKVTLRERPTPLKVPQ